MRFLNFLRGIGSVLEIAPDPARDMIEPLYRVDEDERPERAIYRSWEQVGNYLIAASGMHLVETQAQDQESA